MTGIAILGSGISGLHLALRLRQLGVPCHLYSESTVEELADRRPRNFPARFAPTQDRERRLGVFDWDRADAQAHAWEVSVRAGEIDLGFHAALRPPSSVVDFRVYLPHLLRAYAERGGDLTIGASSLALAARRHDLVVVADGGREAHEVFPRDPTRSPESVPQRVLCAGLYQGITETVPHSVDFHVIAGVGEIFRIPFWSRQGRTDVLAFEAVPGGPLEKLRHLDIRSEPGRFRREILSAVERFAPALRERIDTAGFGLLAPGELVQGAVTPIVRHGWASVEGTPVLAIGDAWITNDPLTAQGANLGSHSAFVLADLLAGHEGPFDAPFAAKASDQLWEHARHVVAWSTAFTRPPAPHVLDVFARAARDPRVADAFIGNFHDPVAMWAALSSPGGARAFLDAFPDTESDEGAR